MNIPAYSPPKSPLPSTKSIRLYPSRYWLYAFCASHTGVMAAITCTSLTVSIKGILITLTGICLMVFIQQWRNQPIRRIQCLHGHWYAINECPTDTNGTAKSSPINNQRSLIINWHFRSIYILILIIKNEQGQRHYLPVMRDSCKPDEFRWLRVLVKFLLP